jgi:hypothetical protein
MAQSTGARIIGKIEIPEPKKNHPCLCDHCGNKVDDSFGDPRTEVYSVCEDGSRKVRYLCEYCIQDFDNISTPSIKTRIKMTQPKYYEDMRPYFPEDINGRITEIEKEISDIWNLKESSRLSAEDMEDVSDNYQWHLEWNAAISELKDELECLLYHKHIIH